MGHDLHFLNLAPQHALVCLFVKGIGPVVHVVGHIAQYIAYYLRYDIHPRNLQVVFLREVLVCVCKLLIKDVLKELIPGLEVRLLALIKKPVAFGFLAGFFNILFLIFIFFLQDLLLHLRLFILEGIVVKETVQRCHIFLLLREIKNLGEVNVLFFAELLF